MFAEIVLPAGKNRITIGEIPALFAEAIYPALAEVAERQITELKKYPLNAKNKREWCGASDGHAFPVRLTDADLKALQAGVWAALPRLNLPLLESAWEPYRAAFESRPPNGWRLEVTRINPNMQHDWEWGTAETEYRKAVKMACFTGALLPYDPVTLLPAVEATGQYLESCFVTVDVLRSYANSVNIGVRLESDTPQATQPQPQPLSVVSNSTKPKRRDSLTPVIEMAQAACRNPHDTAEVWAALQVLAEKKQAPLIGATEDGLQYLKKGNAEIFTRESLRKRLAR